MAYAVLILALLACASGYFGHREYVRARDAARLEDAARSAASRIKAQLQVYLTMMKGVRALFSASTEVTFAELSRYFSVLRIEDLQREEGLEGVGIISVVRPGWAEPHQKSISGQIPGYRLVSKRTNETMYPIIYLERFGHGSETSPVGWDVGENEIRREALERAANGEPAATRRTPILYSGLTNTADGFVVYLPIFQRNPRGEEALTAFVFCSFDTTRLWGSLFRDLHEPVDLEVFDGPPSLDALLFDRDGHPHFGRNIPARSQTSISIEIFGRQWTVLSHFIPRQLSFWESHAPNALFALGIIVSFALFGFVFFQTSSRETAVRLTRSLSASEQAARQANEELARKVSETAASEARLAAEKERLAVTLASISDAVVATDTEGRIELMNPVAEQMAEITLTQALGRPIDTVLPLRDENPSMDTDFFPMRGSREASLKVSILVSPSGSQKHVQKRSAPIHDGSGNVRGAVIVYRDITQERRFEEELLRASKLESLGLLAGGIAHDFNNVLTGIVGNLSLLREAPGLPAEVAERLALLEKTAYKARQLTLQLLTFAKGGSPIKQTASIAEILRESAEFALRGANIRAEFDLPPDLAPVEIDTGQMGQVVQNLVINSKQAMPKGGIIRVSALNCQVEPSANLPLPPGAYVRISIADNGSGIKRENLDRIFDPYFTTKTGGSGLGLATVYSVLKRHEGLVTVESEWGQGSTFHLYLPASNAILPKAPEDLARTFRHSAKLLAMDDEPAIRTLLIQILGHFGCRCIAVPSGAEAIQEYERALAAGEPFDAVIMDLTVPGGMGGAEAVLQLRKLDPNVRAIVSSGYCNDPILANFRAHGFVARVEKPYRLHEISAVLAEVLPKQPPA